MLNEHDIETKIYAGVSEPEHAHLTVEFGGVPCEVPNLPLGNKWNHVINTAYHQEAPDYYFIVGSDDFFASDLIAQYVPFMQDRYPYIGIEGMYFAEPATGRALLFPGYPIEHPMFGCSMGAGRMLRGDIMPARPWPWFAEIGLDGDISKLYHHYHRILLPMTPEYPAVDVKTDTNMWRYDVLQQSYKGAPLLEASIDVLRALPEGEELLAL